MAATPDNLKDPEKHIDKKWTTRKELLDTIVTVHVGEGLTKKTFGIHKGLLCETSSVFQAELDGKFKEAVEQIIDLPEESVSVFELFMLWIYTGSILEEGETDKDLSWGKLVNLYIFAEARDISKLQNTTIDMLIDKNYTLNQSPVEQFQTVYDNTRKTSALRRLFIDIAAQRGALTDDTWFGKQNHGLYPEEFLFDLIKALHKRGPDSAPIGHFKTVRQAYHLPISN